MEASVVVLVETAEASAEGMEVFMEVPPTLLGS